MAKVGLGRFGELVPQRGQTPTANTVNNGDTNGGLDQATQRFGQNLQAVAEPIIAKAEQEAAKQAARAVQIQQLTAHAGIQTGLADLSDELNAGLTAGTLKKDEARKTWTERSGKVVSEKVAGLPADLVPLVTAQMQELGGRLNNRLEDTIRKRDQQDADGGLLTYREQMQRFAGTDMEGAVKQWEQTARTAGPAAGWTPEKVEKEVQGFRETVNYTRAYELVSGARNNRGMLDVAEQAISQMAGLDPQKKAVLMDRTAAYKFSLDQRAEMQAARAARQAEATLKRAEATFQTFQGVSDKGLAMDPAYIDTVIRQTAGTPYQAGVVALAKQAQEAGGLASMPVPAQRAALDAITAQIAKDGNTPALARRRDQIQKVLSGSSTDIKQDPLRAYLERSTDAAEFKPLDTSSIAGITQSLAERMPIAERARLWSGAPVSPLTGEEIEPVRRILDNLQPKERSAAIATLSTAMGPQGAAGMALQLNDKDRALGLAFATAGAQTTQGRFVSELILKGAAAEKDGTSTKNKGTADVKTGQWKRFMTAELDGVYPSQTLTTGTRDAALYIAHGIASENGGDLSERDMRRAITLAAGGELVEHNGRKVPLPAGMDSDGLAKRLRSISATDIALQAAPPGTPPAGQFVRAAGVPVPVDQFVKSLPGAELSYAGPGKFNVLVGGRPVMTADGKRRITIGAQ
jgi:hypothetical protein